MAPQIPYLTLPELPLLPAFDAPLLGHIQRITIKPFGALIALGVYIGWSLSLRQARRLGLSERVMSSFFVTVMFWAFVGGHVFDVLMYHPAQVTEAPTMGAAVANLLSLWKTQSSFGGFMGAAIGLVIWKLRHGVKNTLPWADTSGSTFPIGWVFGRMGCAVMHDHPGMRSDAWLAVRFPSGGRFDLGLYEMLLTVPLAALFLYLMRRPRPYGYYIGLMCIYYGPTRFALDFLRARDVRDADLRYLDLTPAQWLCSAVLALGLYMFFKATRAAERGEVPVYVGDTKGRDSTKDPPAEAAGQAAGGASGASL